jgi:hypothetical protein
MVTARAWAEGTEYYGQADHDDFDFCTVGEVTYMCRVSHVAGPDTHPTRGQRGAKTWARAAREGLDGLDAAARDLAAALGVLECARKRLAPAGLNTEERERFCSLSGVLWARVEELAGEIERMAAEHPQPVGE